MLLGRLETNLKYSTTVRPTLHGFQIPALNLSKLSRNTILELRGGFELSIYNEKNQKLHLS